MLQASTVSLYFFLSSHSNQSFLQGALIPWLRIFRSKKPGSRWAHCFQRILFLGPLSGQNQEIHTHIKKTQEFLLTPSIPVQNHRLLAFLFLICISLHNSEKPGSQHPHYISSFTQSSNHRERFTIANPCCFEKQAPQVEFSIRVQFFSSLDGGVTYQSSGFENCLGQFFSPSLWLVIHFKYNSIIYKYRATSFDVLGFVFFFPQLVLVL